MSQQAFDDFWAVVQARNDRSDARHGPANRITVQARARNEARLRRHYGLTGGDVEIRDQTARARHRARLKSGVAA